MEVRRAPRRGSSDPRQIAPRKALQGREATANLTAAWQGARYESGAVQQLSSGSGSEVEECHKFRPTLVGAPSGKSEVAQTVVLR